MKQIFFLRKYFAYLCLILLAGTFCGCLSILTTNAFDGNADNGQLGGLYSIKNVDAQLVVALRRNAPRSIVFTEEDDPAAIPLDACISKCQGGKESTEAYHKYLSQMKYFREYSYLARADTAANKAARAVIPILTREYYAKCLRQQQEERLKQEAEMARKKELAAAHEREKLLRLVETGWPQEVKLREFAIKEMPEIWEMVVSRRADIFDHRTSLLKLRTSLIEFGKIPEHDTDYVVSRKKYDEERAALVRIFKSIEKAYLASCKNESLYGSVEAREKTRQVVGECIKDVGYVLEPY